MGRIKKLVADYRETLVVLVGEIIVSFIMFGIYLAVGAFDTTVVYGAILGSGVTVFNLFMLSFFVNRAVARYMRLRGEREMSEEEAAAFALEHAGSVQLAARGSYILRTLMMLAAIVLALILGDCFDVIATVVPLLVYRPIIFVFELLRAKFGNKGLQNNDLIEVSGTDVTDGGGAFVGGEDVSAEEDARRTSDESEVD